jgi:hypothetical protein
LFLLLFVSPRGGYEDEKVEGRRMKKYVQMDDPHCEHLGDAKVDEVLVFLYARRHIVYPRGMHTPTKGSKVNQGQIMHHASWMVCGQNNFFSLYSSPVATQGM